MTKDQLIQAFKELKELGAEKFGIHALLASNTVSNDYYPELARQLFELAVEVVAETGVELDFINLSGGVGINYQPDGVENDIAVIGQGVRQAYEAILIPAGLGQVKIYIFFSNSCSRYSKTSVLATFIFYLTDIFLPLLSFNLSYTAA